MDPQRINLKVPIGSTYDKSITLYQGDVVIKAITAVALGYPPVLTATAHGMPTLSLPGRVTGVRGATKLNTLATVDYSLLKKVTDDTFAILNVDASAYSAYSGGGHVVYTPPLDLTGYTARMHIRRNYSATATLLELTTENGGIVLGDDEGSVQMIFFASETEGFTVFEGVYDLELIDGSGEPTRIIYGAVEFTREVTRP